VVDVIDRTFGLLDRVFCLTFHVFCKALGLTIKIMASLTSFYRPWGALGPTPPETFNVFLVTIAKQAKRVPIPDRIITDIIIEIEARFEPHRIFAQEAASSGIIVSSPVIQKPSFRIELTSSVSKGLHKRPGDGRGVPERVEYVTLI
jgi:hypothetical protein